MRRDTQNVLLVLLGGALLRISVDDTFLRYVRPSHRWLLLAGGAVVVGLAVVGLLRDHLPRRTADRAGGHGHGGAERFAPWLLLVPVLVIALVAPPALGADAVSRVGARGATVRDTDVFTPLPAGGAPALSMAEVVQRALFDRSGSLDGRVVTLTGFAVRRDAATDLARLTISCCAADARVSRVHLAGDVGDPAPDTWLRVQARVVPGSAAADSHDTPTATVVAVERLPTPDDPYEY